MKPDYKGRRLLLARITNRIVRPFGINPFPRAFSPATTVLHEERAEVFDAIYLKNAWGSEQSRSGVGSEVNFAHRYAEQFASLIDEFEIKSVFDAPCGDLNWMQEMIDAKVDGYIGGDISKSLIKDLRMKYPDKDLRFFDICRDVFPDVSLWHCRDCLFHLSFADIKLALENYANSSIPYTLITTHRAYFLHKNLDIATGGFRYLDLERPPINLPRANVYLSDFKKGRDFPRYVGLWSKESIANALKKWSE